MIDTPGTKIPLITGRSSVVDARSAAVDLGRILKTEPRIAAYLLMQGNTIVGEHVKVGAQPHTVKIMLLMALALASVGFPLGTRYDLAKFGHVLGQELRETPEDLAHVFKGAGQIYEEHLGEANLSPLGVKLIALCGLAVASHASQETALQQRDFFRRYMRPVRAAVLAAAEGVESQGNGRMPAPGALMTLPKQAETTQELADWLRRIAGPLHGAVGTFWHQHAESDEVRDSTEGFAQPLVH